MTTEQYRQLAQLLVANSQSQFSHLKLERAATTIDRYDGSDAENTQSWIRTMDDWGEEDVDGEFVIQLAKLTSTGDQLAEIRRWVNRPDAPVSTWAELRPETPETFLSARETLKLQVCTLKALAQVSGSLDGALGDDRVAALACIWMGARSALCEEHETNEAWQQKKRTSQPLDIGDSVIVLLPGLKPTFQPRWDARWEVMRSQDPVYWIHHLPTGQEKVIHWEKLWWVPSNIDWDHAPQTNSTG